MKDLSKQNYSKNLNLKNFCEINILSFWSKVKRREYDHSISWEPIEKKVYKTKNSMGLSNHSQGDLIKARLLTFPYTIWVSNHRDKWFEHHGDSGWSILQDIKRIFSKQNYSKNLNLKNFCEMNILSFWSKVKRIWSLYFLRTNRKKSILDQEFHGSLQSFSRWLDQSPSIYIPLHHKGL